MKKVIHMYETPYAGNQVIYLPTDHNILTAKPVGNRMYIWAEVDPDSEMRKIEIICVPTGGVVPANSTFISTVVFEGGNRVYHVYKKQ